MGVKVSTLAKVVEDAQMRVGPGEEDVVNIRYRPGALTLGALKRLESAAASKDFKPDVFEDLLTPILVSWDLLQDDGTPLPITAEGLDQLPLEFIGELISTLNTATKPDKDEGKASDVTSPSTDEQVTSLIGTSSSEQPAISE
jgi:hypothetical protein